MFVLVRVSAVASVIALAVAVVGCDSTTFDRCVYSDDPASASPATRQEGCPPSTFKVEEPRSREISGTVRRGPDPVSGAFIRVEPWPELVTTKTASPSVSTVTDSVGFFGGLRPVALRYDLTAKLDADVIVFRGVAGRSINPSLDIPTRKFPRAWANRVDAKIDRPVPEDRAIVFFANGDGVFGVTGDLVTGLSIMSRDFAGKATLHAIEFEKGKGLDTATAYGKAELAVSAAAPQLAVLHLDPIASFGEPSFAVTSPPGFPVPDTVDVIIDFAPLSDALLTTLPVGVKKKVPIIPNVFYRYRTSVTTSDGAKIETGEIPFGAFAPVTSIVLPTPPSVSPAVPDSIAANEPLVASGTGVLEHVLTPVTPQNGEGTTRIIVKQRDARLPDLASMGGPPMRGTYTWTVVAYEKLRFVEELANPDARRYNSMAASKPRSLIIR